MNIASYVRTKCTWLGRSNLLQYVHIMTPWPTCLEDVSTNCACNQLHPSLVTGVRKGLRTAVQWQCMSSGLPTSLEWCQTQAGHSYRDVPLRTSHPSGRLYIKLDRDTSSPWTYCNFSHPAPPIWLDFNWWSLCMHVHMKRWNLQ